MEVLSIVDKKFLFHNAVFEQMHAAKKVLATLSAYVKFAALPVWFLQENPSQINDSRRVMPNGVFLQCNKMGLGVAAENARYRRS